MCDLCTTTISYQGALRAFLFGQTIDVAIQGSTANEIVMWLRAIELYADLARGGDGTGIISAPEAAKSLRMKHHSEKHVDGATGEEKDISGHGAAHVSGSAAVEDVSPGVRHVDRVDPGTHVQTLIRPAGEVSEEKEEAEGKEGLSRIAYESRIINHQPSFRESARSDKILTYEDYDNSHHLVVHHNVDTGVTTFNKDGTMHTNFYF